MLVATMHLEVQKKCTQAGLKVTLAGISFLGFLAVNVIANAESIDSPRKKKKD